MRLPRRTHRVELGPIQPFIFNWRRQFERTRAIENALRAIFDDVTVINSDEAHPSPGWVHLGESAYFSDQFKTALRLFDASALMHVQGDVSYDDWPGLVEAARDAYRAYAWGVFAPHVDYSWHSAETSDIRGIALEPEDLKMCACTDETAWFIHRDVIREFHDRNLMTCFEGNRLGWGWDLVMCGLSFLMGRPVIRDYRHVVEHPVATGYDRGVAATEMVTLLDRLPSDLAECISTIRTDQEKIVRYFVSSGAGSHGR